MDKRRNLILWKPGQSGNPKGRPKGSKNLSTILDELLDREITVTDPISGEKEKKRLREIVALQLIAQAIKGDRQAIKDIYDRLEGTPKQTVEGIGDQLPHKVEVEIITGKNANIENERNEDPPRKPEGEK